MDTDKTEQNDEVQEDTLEEDNTDDHAGTTESDGETPEQPDEPAEEDSVTLTKAELEEREKQVRKEQDKRWKDRLKSQKDGKEGGKEGSAEVDRIDRIELKSEGVKEADQQDFVIEYARTKEMSVGDALSSRVVQAELKEMQAAHKEKTAAASPSSRTGTHRQDDPAYWAKQLTEKGKSAPTSEMRKKVREYLAQDQ